MRPFFLAIILLTFLVSTCMNCLLYGTVERIPYFGITMTQHAEQERDIFMLMYIAGGTLVPRHEKIRDVSLSLVRRSYKKTFKDAPLHVDPIGPYATGRTFDLPALLVRILYWVPPAALALLLVVILIPNRLRSKEEF